MEFFNRITESSHVLYRFTSVAPEQGFHSEDGATDISAGRINDDFSFTTEVTEVLIFSTRIGRIKRILIIQTQMTQMTRIFFLSSNKVKNQLNPRRKNQSHSAALKSAASAASASENIPSEGKPCRGAMPLNYHLQRFPKLLKVSVTSITNQLVTGLNLVIFRQYIYHIMLSKRDSKAVFQCFSSFQG